MIRIVAVPKTEKIWLPGTDKVSVQVFYLLPRYQAVIQTLQF